MLWWQKRCHIGVDRAVKYCGGNQGQHPGWDKVKYTAINGHNCRQTGARDHETRRFDRGPHRKYFKIWDFDDWQALKKNLFTTAGSEMTYKQCQKKENAGRKKGNIFSSGGSEIFWHFWTCLFYCEPNKPASNLQQRDATAWNDSGGSLNFYFLLIFHWSAPFAALDDENWPLMAPSGSLRNRGSAKSLTFLIFWGDPVRGFLQCFVSR